ncbi:MAG: haloacid dehalogenase-like hydrolase [Acidimicrobiia bacterium]|nr:haloacid dehalogenase-like hydrolase [Acidimicrobiia bacterium]
MPPPPLQTVIAFIWDFDSTLIVGNQQDALFEHYGVDPQTFWAEVEALPAFHRERGEIISRDTAYLVHLLTYVEAGVLPGLDNARLRELGGRLCPSPGIPEFLAYTRRRVAENPALASAGIVVEHYAVSTGLLPMIEGSPIAPYLDGIWANTLLEHTALPGYLHGAAAWGSRRITRQGLVVDGTTKTRAIFEINKGTNRDPAIDVNAPLPEEQRRVPFSQMIYVADGFSDVPAFALLNDRGGRTFGVYPAAPAGGRSRAEDLHEQGRIQGMAEADFRPGTAAYRWLVECLDGVAGEVLAARRRGAPEAPRSPGCS